MIRTTKIITMIAGGIFAAAAVAAPAEAASRSFSTAGRGDAGYATGGVHIKFTGKRTIKGGAWAKDVCPKNGKGAYLRLMVIYKDGSYSAGQVSDNNGCGNGRESGSLSGKYKKRIKYVTASLCEKDVDGDDRGYCTKWKRIDNPHT